MPFIKFFRCNVRHAVALVIYFSFYLLISLHFSFHLSTFREYSYTLHVYIIMHYARMSMFFVQYNIPILYSS